MAVTADIPARVAAAKRRAAHYSRTVFNVEGMRCANCAAAVERAVRGLEGVQHFTVNAATARAALDWEPDKVSLTRVFNAIRKAGFKPVDLAGEAAANAQRLERRGALKRIGVAGLGMMQTMMFVYALYAGGAHGVNAQIAEYLRLAGMLLATPVLVYSGAPFFGAAVRDLRQGRLGMDVPVSIALVLAFSASVVNTLRGSGEIYYDSVTMFIFFLSVGRFAEMSVRQRSVSASEAFARSVPGSALRLRPDGGTEEVAVGIVRTGDVLSVARGAIVPVDATLRSERAFVDESLITGESSPVAKARGSELLGGSVNTADRIEIVCAAPAESSALAGIVALLRRTAAARPPAVAAADRAASVLSLVTLTLAGLVALYWGMVNPSYVMSATLAVLVVTCPCALSLATPATFAAATSRLARLGLLVVKPDALERLARVDTVILDKTGTLTEGAPVARIAQRIPGVSDQRALALAAALERGSDHPLARAFASFTDPGIVAGDIREFVGQGLQGCIAGEIYRLGRLEFVGQVGCGDQSPAAIGLETSGAREGASDGSLLALGGSAGVLATFCIQEEVSGGAASAVTDLQRQGLEVAIASGDGERAVRRAAAFIRIGEFHSGMSFDEKLELVKQRQAEGRNVLMVGDGINDGPVLAAADVSCAMTRGSAIAQSASDLLLLDGSLAALGHGVRLARKAKRVIRQNLTWAFVYNLTAIPLAAAGLVAPWVAALGMSLSSLAVVMNAARLAAGKPVTLAGRL